MLPPLRQTRAPLPKDPPTDDEVAEALRRAGFNPVLPVHVLAASKWKRKSTEAVCRHSFSGDPPGGLFATADENVLVVSPELCLLQLASTLSPVDLAWVGYELCGTYACPTACPAQTRFGCEVATTPARLRSFERKAQGLKGVKRFRRSLPHILPDSASPMESLLAMLLTLPYAYGGYSLSKPQLNIRINPGKRGMGLVNQGHYICDLFWKDARLAVEYDSNRFHTGAEKIAEDSRRRNDLAALGIAVVTVTSDQIFDPRQMDKVAGTLAKRLGERIDPRDESYPRRQAELRQRLFSRLEERPAARLFDVGLPGDAGGVGDGGDGTFRHPEKNEGSLGPSS